MVILDLYESEDDTLLIASKQFTLAHAGEMMCMELKEPLINSGRDDVRFKNVHFKARIAGNSSPIVKIRNAEVDVFGLTAAVHELIRGSLITVPHGSVR